MIQLVETPRDRPSARVYNTALVSSPILAVSLASFGRLSVFLRTSQKVASKTRATCTHSFNLLLDDCGRDRTYRTMWSNKRELLEFLECYQRESLSWNPKDVGHKNKQSLIKHNAGMQISLYMDIPVEVLKKKGDSHMATLREHKRKINALNQINTINVTSVYRLHCSLGPLSRDSRPEPLQRIQPP
ncbi:unnamed protein product [Pieris brassicae]|uniref:Uncharacterized protein n=1 Tax=Pieris brassicae TaxID=7116 RepID=A0A9P0TGE5_PIEBR|nr:unnamed protein product [Pieris brassicae]